MSQDDIRQMNNLLILKLLREEGAASMPQLSQKTKLTLPAVSAIISEIELFGLVRNSGIQQVKRGRFPSLYEFDGESYNVLSLVIRPDSISVGLINLNGSITKVLSEAITEDKDAERIVDISAALIKETISNSKLPEKGILGLGISMHGIVDPERGISIYPSQLNWRDYPLIEKLKERFDFPMIMDNDMNCLLLAEKWFGSAKDIESFAIINIDYGVGMAIMSHSSVLRGEDYGAGQIGHIPVNESSIKCNCGKVGCLETLASEKAILRDIIDEIKAGRESEVFNLAKRDIKEISLEHIYRAANAGDKLSLQIINKAGHYLGKGLSILVNILNPKMIVITGGILRSKEVFFSAFNDALNTYALSTNIKNLEICPSLLEKNNDLIGAAALWIDAIFTGKMPLNCEEYRDI